ncbi:DUF5994 family protein [Streptomyces sp. GSL17-111]|uniref:DUF5994 family protein n=1 Tax=Streptomyces sp. GSL17-111 TaxID=3121596 RepID=UPI0030F44FFB
MNHPPGPDSPRLLPDTIRTSAKPGTALIRLRTTHVRDGVLDGAWWPRSRDLDAELPYLISALTAHIGPVTRVGLDAAAWDDLPTRVIVDDRTVHIDSSPVGDSTVLVTRGERDHFSLLVVPPDAAPEAARTAMARAVGADNVTDAVHILMETSLIETGSDPSRPG